MYRKAQQYTQLFTQMLILVGLVCVLSSKLQTLNAAVGKNGRFTELAVKMDQTKDMLTIRGRLEGGFQANNYTGTCDGIARFRLIPKEFVTKTASFVILDPKGKKVYPASDVGDDTLPDTGVRSAVRGVEGGNWDGYRCKEFKDAAESVYELNFTIPLEGIDLADGVYSVELKAETAYLEDGKKYSSTITDRSLRFVIGEQSGANGFSFLAPPTTQTLVNSESIIPVHVLCQGSFVGPVTGIKAVSTFDELILIPSTNKAQCGETFILKVSSNNNTKPLSEPGNATEGVIVITGDAEGIGSAKTLANLVIFGFPEVSITTKAVRVGVGESAEVSWEGKFSNSCSAIGDWKGELEIRGARNTQKFLVPGSQTLGVICYGALGAKSSPAQLTISANTTKIRVEYSLDGKVYSQSQHPISANYSIINRSTNKIVVPLADHEPYLNFNGLNEGDYELLYLSGNAGSSDGKNFLYTKADPFLTDENGKAVSVQNLTSGNSVTFRLNWLSGTKLSCASYKITEPLSPRGAELFWALPANAAYPEPLSGSIFRAEAFSKVSSFYSDAPEFYTVNPSYAEPGKFIISINWNIKSMGKLLEVPGVYKYHIMSSGLCSEGTLLLDVSGKPASIQSLNLQPDSLDYSYVNTSNNQTSKQITVTNTGDAKVVVEVKSSANWVEVKPNNFSLNPSQKTQISVKVKSDTFNASTSTYLTFTETKGLLAPRVVPISVTVQDPDQTCNQGYCETNFDTSDIEFSPSTKIQSNLACNGHTDSRPSYLTGNLYYVILNICNSGSNIFDASKAPISISQKFYNMFLSGRATDLNCLDCRLDVQVGKDLKTTELKISAGYLQPGKKWSIIAKVITLNKQPHKTAFRIGSVSNLTIFEYKKSVQTPYFLVFTTY